MHYVVVVYCYSYAAVGPAGNFYEACEENSPSLYQDYGKGICHIIQLLQLLSIFHTRLYTLHNDKDYKMTAISVE